MKSFAAVVLASLWIAGCASTAREPMPAAADHADTGFVASSPAWLSGALAEADPGEVGARAAGSNVALRPPNPWLGTIGLRRSLGQGSEVGVGVCLPSNASSVTAPTGLGDRARAVGVGVWLGFGF